MRPSPTRRQDLTFFELFNRSDECLGLQLGTQLRREAFLFLPGFIDVGQQVEGEVVLHLPIPPLREHSIDHLLVHDGQLGLREPLDPLKQEIEEAELERFAEVVHFRDLVDNGQHLFGRQGNPVL